MSKSSKETEKCMDCGKEIPKYGCYCKECLKDFREKNPISEEEHSGHCQDLAS